MEVHRTLGPGFSESIYRNAFCHELQNKGLEFECEQEVRVTYKGQTVAKYRLDLFIDGCVIVELKAATSIADVHVAQALSYLKATEAKVSLVMNFGGRSLTWKRLIKTRN